MKSLMKPLAAALVAAALASVVMAQSQDNPPSLTTDDVLLIPEAASYEYAQKRYEAARRAAMEAQATKATKGYRRVVTPSGFAFERPESWKPIENLEASGAPGGFRSEAIYQDDETGAVLTAMSFDRASATDPLDISSKEVVDRILTSMLNPDGDAKANPKVVRREMGESPESGIQWVRVKAEGMSRAENGGAVPATYWVQMSQSKDLLAVVVVAFPSDQKKAAVPAFHSVRTLEVVNAGTRESASRAGAAAKEEDGASGMRQQ